MRYLTGLGAVLAIIAIVIVAGVIIAFLGKIIINVFDVDRKLDKKDDTDEIENIRQNVYNAENTQTNTNTYTYNNASAQNTQPQQSSFNYTDEEDFSYAKDVDSAVARKEKEDLEKEIAEDNDFFKDYKSTINSSDIEEDDEDLMNMINEISNDVLDEKKVEIDAKNEEESKKNTSTLDKYSIDDILNDNFDDEEDEEEEDEVAQPITNQKAVADESVAEMKNIRDDIMKMLEEMRSLKQEPVAEQPSMELVEANIDNIDNRIEEEVAKRVDEKIGENLSIIEDLKRALEEKEAEVASERESKKALAEQYDNINKNMVEQFNMQNREIENQIQNSMSASIDQINNLKAQLASLTKQLEEERSLNWKVAESYAHKEVAKSEPEIKEEPKKVEVVEEEKADEQPVEQEDEQEVIDIVANEELVEDDTNENEEEVVDEEIQQIATEEVQAQVEERLEESNEVIKELTQKIEMLTSEVKTEEIVTFQFSSEAQYQARIEILEERLRQAKKDLKINDKEYKPLEKVKRTLERDKAKLRRKEAIAAKKKVALYGVNNYVDIDKEKAEKLAHELELLDGLRLSVSHCEEVMNANTERYPILEHTHNILVNNIRDIEADIMHLNKELKALRDGNKDNQ